MMKTSVALETIYKIMEGLEGQREAKSYVSDAVYLAICSLQAQGLPVTAENLEKEISEKAQDYIEAYKSVTAA